MVSSLGTLCVVGVQVLGRGGIVSLTITNTKCDTSLASSPTALLCIRWGLGRWFDKYFKPEGWRPLKRDKRYKET
jgi:hypothetical protein